MNFKEFMAAKYPDIEPSGIVFLAMKATWNACKEECAKVAEGRVTDGTTHWLSDEERCMNHEVEQIAKAIRELK